MKCSSQNCENHRLAKMRIIALVLLICFISASLFSGAFILTFADHVHDHNGVGGSCAACVQIQNAESFLKLLGTAVVGGFTLLGYYAATMVVRALCSNIAALTPITTKTRMNN